MRVTAYRLSAGVGEPTSPWTWPRSVVESASMPAASRRRRPCGPGRARRSARSAPPRWWGWRQAMSRIRCGSPAPSLIGWARPAPGHPAHAVVAHPADHEPVAVATPEAGDEPAAVARDQEAGHVAPGDPRDGQHGRSGCPRRRRPGPRPGPRSTSQSRSAASQAGGSRSAAPLRTWRTGPGAVAPARAARRCRPRRRRRRRRR